ncbi:MAG: FtsW/RodA/SpoVE family cell cycle protein [Planctomycetota bacterium]
MHTKVKNNSLANDIGAVVILLMAVGTVFVFSAGANISQAFELRKFYDFQSLRQILFFPLAVIVMYVASLFDYRRLGLSKGWFRSPVFYLLVVSIVLLIVVLLPQVGVEKNNARRWLSIPAGPISISFQPSELAKWALVFFLAAFCDRFRASMTLYWKRFLPACLVSAAIVGLIIIEDFGTAALVALLAFLMLLFGGAKWWHVLTPAPFGAAGFFLALMSSPARLQRLAAFMDPEKWAATVAYQANQSLVALGSGGLWGKGLGRGICKYGHLPEDTTDFIFAVIGEELGFVGTMGVIALFLILVWLGILVVVRCEDRFGQLLAGGIVLAIGVQAALNIGVVTVVLPTKGISLPFVSAGGTGMLLSAAAVGVLLNIAKNSHGTAVEKQG